MNDCYCKNCGMEYAWVNDKDSGNCWSCKQPLVPTKRRPKKRASDGLKSTAKNQSSTAEVKTPAKKRKSTSRA